MALHHSVEVAYKYTERIHRTKRFGSLCVLLRGEESGCVHVCLLFFLRTINRFSLVKEKEVSKM